MKLRPFYLPREFPSIIVNVVYIPPHANVNNARECIMDAVTDQQTKSPESAVYVTGDVNKCDLQPSLTNFTQYVTEPTREDKILDQLFCNVPNAYKCTILAPLGRSDHKMVLLCPKYKPVLKCKKVESRTITKILTNDEDRLRDCFDTTDWGMFIDTCDNINELCDTISSYICFCENVVSVEKTVSIFPNSKLC